LPSRNRYKERLMSEHNEQDGENESSADTKDESERKHSFVRALLCAGHDIEFSFQNSLTIAGVVIVPLVVAWLTAVGFAVPLPPALALGLLVPVWFILLKAAKYAKSRKSLYGFGGACSTVLLVSGFLLAYALKPKAMPIPPPSVVRQTTQGAGSAAVNGDGNKVETHVQETQKKEANKQ
jgi:predicted tellurium resistance membrane protein TerC